MRTCYRCKVSKEDQDFGKGCTYCKPCEKIRWKERIEGKREKYNQNRNEKYYSINIQKCPICMCEFGGQKKFCSDKCRLRGTIKMDGECWIYQGFKHANGYGSICINGKAEYAHRASYKVFKGLIDPKRYVCHTCDRRDCINPEHLFVGSAKDNMDDAKSKGRLARGEKVKGYRWNREQILWLKKLSQEGKSQTEIAKIFGMDANHVSKILRGKIWSTVQI